MKIVHYFLKTDNKGKVQYQGAITQLPDEDENGEGFYFDWILGDISTEFTFTDGFLNEIILFNNDAEMRSFYESNKQEKVFT